MSDSNSDSKKEDRKPLLVLVGPTAVGKTALALKVARRLKTDIISADSAQIYYELDIGTAKPSPEEQKIAKHHLIDLVYPHQYFSVADYQKLAHNKIEQLWEAGKLPFMVGGTGLYISAVTKNYAFGQKGPSSDLRQMYEQLAAAEGLEKLYARLKSIDPEAASKIHPNDKKRIIRALEVYTLEGKPISRQVTNTESRQQSIPYKTLIFGLDMDREALYERIEKRVEMMFRHGFPEEVRSLARQGYSANDPGMKVLGYRQLLAYLEGKMGFEEAKEEIKKQTRNLAKRQLTWFRRDKAIEWIDITEIKDFNNLTENICFKVKDIAP